MTMKIVLILSLCCAVPIYGQQSFSTKPRATDESYFFGLEQEYLNKLKCVTRIDAILNSKWTTDLEKISTEGLDIVEPEWKYRWPSKPMYNTVEQEWVMESGSSSKKIESCMRGLLPEIVPLMNRTEISCVNSILAKHIEEEAMHEDVFKRSLKSKARDQPPFRKFLNFGEYFEMLYGSRTPDAFTNVETEIYEDAKGYLTTDQDKINPTFTIELSCTWKNTVALRKAQGIEAKLNEFVRQVKDGYNLRLAHQLVTGWFRNDTLHRDSYLAWLRARDNMTLQINEEVDRLRDQKKDDQWLCEHAAELADGLYQEQWNIFPQGQAENYGIDITSGDVAQHTRDIEKAMEKTKDFRHPLLKTLAEKFEEGARCLSAFLHLVQHHRRFDAALAFVDSEYDFAEFFCKNSDLTSFQLGTMFCKCVGSFCVYHHLDYLYPNEYVLTEGPDGIYSVVPTGSRAKDVAEFWAKYRDTEAEKEKGLSTLASTDTMITKM